MAFQTTVAANPAYAVAGDFASANPWRSVDAGVAQYVADTGGVTLGVGGWANPTTGLVSNTYNGGLFGIAGRTQQGYITTFLGSASMVMNEGLPVTLYDGGDFWASFAAGGAFEQKVYANLTTGVLTAGATGSNPAGGSGTASSISGTTLTVGGTVTGTFAPGQIISGSGVTAGTYIIAQLTGTTGGAGTYSVSVSQSASSTTITSISAIETGFTLQSSASSGELAIIAG